MCISSLQGSAVIPSHADLSFTVLLLNADSAGNPLEHFSAEEAGQTSHNTPVTTAQRRPVHYLIKYYIFLIDLCCTLHESCLYTVVHLHCFLLA